MLNLGIGILRRNNGMDITLLVMNNVNNLMELSVETMFVNAALKTNVKIN
jgi:hypothetical protein